MRSSGWSTNSTAKVLLADSTCKGTFSPFSPEEHSAAFSRVHEAMGRLKIPLRTRTALFKFMAGLLHLSHLRLGGDESVSVEQPRALPVIEELLGIKEETLEVALCKQEKFARKWRS